MAMWPFNRKKDQELGIPQEVQDYYQAEKREKVGIAGLLALGTLLVTIVLAMGLFFGGRWVYRTVFDDDKPTQTAQEVEEPAPQPEESGESEGEGEPEPAPAPESEPTPEPTPEPEADEPRTVATSNTADEDLPNTGPGDTVAIFLATIVLASLAYYQFGNREFSRN